MARMPGIRRRFRFPFSEARVRREVEEEIAFHVDARTQELMARGMALAEARTLALKEFGDVREARFELEKIGHRRARQLQRSDWWGDLRQDVRYGARSLVHAPLFSLLAIVTLALGIGANAAVFGVLKSVLLDALPYADADRLVRVYGRFLDGSMERGPLSAGTVDVIGSRQGSFERLTAFQGGTSDAVYGGDDGPRTAKIAWVDPAFFETLGVSMALGRTFDPDEGTNGLVPLTGGQVGPDTARVVVVTHAAWQRLFANDPGLLGQDIRINGLPRTVIGVLPPEFTGPMGDADFYFALDLAPVVAHPVTVRRSQWLGLIGRLKRGVTFEAARDEIAGIWSGLAREYPQDNGTLGVTAMPLRDAMVGDTRTPLVVLMTSAGLVLLIACANLAGALLSRILARRKEFAVRVALGAGRGRLVRQLLTESLLLALVGGGAGLLLAVLLMGTIPSLTAQVLPAYADLTLDAGAVFLTTVLALGTGVIFGVAPALAIGRADAQATLRDETRGASESRGSRRVRGVLVAGQIALSLSLLAGAGLLARSLWALTGSPLGFDPDGVLTATVRLPPHVYPTPAARARFLEQFTERVRQIPGVDAAATATSVPTMVRSRSGLTKEGTPPNDAQPFVLVANVSDDYFRTLRIPLRQGRTFDPQDRADAPLTVVISESMARRYWPNGDALGTRIRLGPNPNGPLMEVVGVVGDVRNDRARPDAEPMAYRSNRQGSAPFVSVLLRTAADPLALVRPVERELGALDAGLPLERPMTLRAVLGEGLAGRRLPVLLMTAFGLLALLLASVGIYALFASMATAREREFGVRMALGSRPRALAGLVLRQGAGWMAAGLAGGGLGIAVVVHLLRDLLYEVPPFDPIALGVAVAILVCCATLALLIPLRRATRVDPAIALRAQ